MSTISNVPLKLYALRASGWTVAAHNDYRLNGKSYTFWLFTHPNGTWIKGEGATDEEALIAAEAMLECRGACDPVGDMLKRVEDELASLLEGDKTSDGRYITIPDPGSVLLSYCKTGCEVPKPAQVLLGALPCVRQHRGCASVRATASRGVGDVSDQANRNIERAAVLTNSAEDQAKVLVARMRSGTLAPFKLQLAALWGHPIALLALGVDPPRPNPLRAIVVEHDRPRLYKSEWEKFADGMGTFLRANPPHTVGNDVFEAGIRAMVTAAQEVVAQVRPGEDQRAVRHTVTLGGQWVAEHPHTREQAAELLRVQPECDIRDRHGKHTRDSWHGGIISGVLWTHDMLAFDWRHGFPGVVTDALRSAGDLAQDCEKLRTAVRKSLSEWALA